MTDYEDYENNLAFPPTTDRTASTIELVNKIEKLNKWLDLKSEYIGKLEKENERLKWWLREIVNNHGHTPISTAEKALKEFEE